MGGWAGSTWLGSFGIAGTNYCGPGFSDGKLLDPGELSTYSAPYLGLVDQQCMFHDMATDLARSAPNPAEAQFAADIRLLIGLSQLEANGQLTLEDRALATAIVAAFEAKLLVVDTPLVVIEAAQNLLKQLLGGLAGVGSVILDIIVPSAYGAHLNPELNTHFLAARGLVLRDPLAIDLDGDGIETVGTDAGVLFDHDGDGIKTGTGWVAGDDALVVLDRDGNGLIDSGRELFGIDTVVGADALGNPLYVKDGFDALSSLDANGDTLFDANDTAYADVRLWRDLNQDGISQSGELQSLADAGISAIDLAARQARQTLAGGNVQTLAAGVAGIAGSAVALDLASNPFYRDHPDSLDTTAVADLPDMQGCGSLRDLKEAATQSGALETQLRTIASQGYVDQETYSAQIKALIDAWADTESRRWQDGGCIGWGVANEGVWRRVA